MRRFVLAKTGFGNSWFERRFASGPLTFAVAHEGHRDGMQRHQH